VASLLIVNPRASGVTEEITARVRAALPDDLEIRETHGPGTATEIAREHEQAVDAIYVLSGDGTYNEVVNGVAGTVPLGFLPGGGTSVLPRALGLGRDPVAAAGLVASGTTRRIGLGRVNGRRFAFNAGIGFDAELVRRIDTLGRAPDGRRPGDLAFVREALALLAGHRGSFPDRLDVEGGGRAAFALVANCHPYTYAGRMRLRVSRGASFDLGLDLVAPRAFGAATLPRVALALVRGTPSERRFAVIRDADRIVVHCDEPLPLQVDGEDLGDVETAVFEAERNAVNALVPG
jgi:diacylglycerol kinase family enzyme